ncbi:MAG: hypothetical protein M0R46_12855 [Candidatus Muirbacterium halophilum]|nr:hypothetical protein [Candidatus Muirbacterium halophilum]
MKILKYKQFVESLTLNINIDIMESLNIWHDVLLNAIDAKEVDFYDTLKLPKDIYKQKLDIDFLYDNVEFINSLSSLSLKKSTLNKTDDYSTFVNKPCKWMFIYDINSSELDNPIYILFQVWNDVNKEWGDVKLYNINDDVKKFYDKLSSRTIEIIDGGDKYIYQTSDVNDWVLQNKQETEVYKKVFRKEELQTLLNTKNLKINII